MRTDLEIVDYGPYCVIIGPETNDRGHRGALLPQYTPNIWIDVMRRHPMGEAFLERMQQLESCSLLDLDHYARPGTWGTIVKMPVQFAEMEKV